MHTRRAIAIASACVGLGGGCSLAANFSGLVGDAGGDGGSADAFADQAVDVSTFDVASSDSTTDSTGPCVPSVTLSPDGGLGQLVPFSTLTGYPNVESFFGDTAMVLLPFRDLEYADAGPDADPEAGPVVVQTPLEDQHVGLWLASPTPVTAFDVSFDAKIVCTANGNCADGLIFAWLDMTDTSALNNSLYGDTAGLPKGVSGAAFDMDDYKNSPSEVDDPYAPSLQIVSIVGTETLDTYPWQVAITPSTFPGDWHRYTVRLRGGAVATTYDGALSVSAQIPPLASAIVGFTAGVGGESDAVAIRNVSAQFYNCMP